MSRSNIGDRPNVAPGGLEIGMQFRRITALIAFAYLFCGIGPAQADPPVVARFDGERVVRVTTSNEAELKTVLSLTDDVWSERTGVGPLDIRVSPGQYARLANTGLPFKVLIEDVQTLIDRERNAPHGRATFDNYMPNDDVNAYMATLVALRPDLAQPIVVGQSLQNRSIKGIRITGSGSGAKPGVLFHGCEHAREWITVPVALYVADQLVRRYDTDPYIHSLVDRCEFFIVPVFNVDGYVYTWSANRLWRKNLRDNDNNGVINNSDGVDINRNWGYNWGGEGASSSPSNETYRGPSAFSEPETRAMRDFFLAHPNIVTHNDLHSYSQLILWPWGYTPTPTDDQATFDLMGNQMYALIVGVYGTTFDPGQIYTNIYPASGVSVDWAYGIQNVLSFSYELRDTGENGFTLPADQILPSCQETLPALLYQADYASTISPAVRIEMPEGIPPALEPGMITEIYVRVTPGWDGIILESPTLHYRTSPSDSFTSIPLDFISIYEYIATFPPRGCGSPTEFYITANGSSGATVFSPANAPASAYSIPVGTQTLAFSDDFETNQGWTVANVSVTAGAWVRVDPVGTTNAGVPAQPEDDHTDSGTMCYVTGQGGVGGTAGTSDLDGGPTRLTSPVIDASGLASAQVSYWRWFYSSGSDSMVVEISNNNGGNWATLETVSSDPAWRQKTFRIADFVAPTNQMRLRFSASDNPNDSITEAAVDDIVVESFECAGSVFAGDLNCDGVVNSTDVQALVLALIDPSGYAAAYPSCSAARGDLNGDSATNGGDIEQFVGMLIGS